MANIWLRFSRTKLGLAILLSAGVGQRAEVAEDHRVHGPHTDAPETPRGARASGEAVPCGGSGSAKDRVAVVRGAALRAACFAGAFCGAAFPAALSGWRFVQTQTTQDVIAVRVSAQRGQGFQAAQQSRGRRGAFQVLNRRQGFFETLDAAFEVRSTRKVRILERYLRVHLGLSGWAATRNVYPGRAHAVGRRVRIARTETQRRHQSIDVTGAGSGVALFGGLAHPRADRERRAEQRCGGTSNHQLARPAADSASIHARLLFVSVLLVPRYTSNDVAAVHDAEQAFLKASLTRLPGRAAASIVAPTPRGPATPQRRTPTTGRRSARPLGRPVHHHQERPDWWLQCQRFFCRPLSRALHQHRCQGSRVAAGHREATRSVLDAWYRRWTIEARGEGRPSCRSCLPGSAGLPPAEVQL
ncbi:hypothetical protein FHX34_103944 [Actinoplanes teichomyceticus]|uniref:Uncharacterized protein n=1 Tax=Actinoplanes teichomyceticus TaxID=1867 RepID=A0A561WC10_ACTTI|nr:hypothetical protein FHX34_103944 [Actinoplanes teichomyceticus]